MPRTSRDGLIMDGGVRAVRPDPSVGAQRLLSLLKLEAEVVPFTTVTSVHRVVAEEKLLA